MSSRVKQSEIAAMQEALREFFQANEFILYFIYGQVFFVTGLAIALQSRKYSRLKLARSLPYLAAFGLTYGLVEWGHVFIPTQARYLSIPAISIMKLAQLFLLALSFVFLLVFGLRLNAPRPVPHRWAWGIPGLLFGLWSSTLFAAWVFHRGSDEQLLLLGEIALRYFMAFPGGLLAAYGLRRQTLRHIAPLQSPHIVSFLRTAGIALIFYSVLAGLIVPPAGFFPADRLNYALFDLVIGVPSPVFQSICGLILAYAIIRAMEVFDLETDRRLEEMARAQALAADRERIGRELHDGTIQSIYAAGLMLEDVALTLDENPATAKSKVEQVMEALNATIQDIRRYIFDLRDELEDSDLTEGVGKLLQDFRVNTLLAAELTVKGEENPLLSWERRQHCLQIVREALTNVTRHAHASKVEIHLNWTDDSLFLSIADDGIGFDPRIVDGQGQGLRNMRERAQLLGGELGVQGRPGHGAMLTLAVPYEPGRMRTV
jgi:signal transduction histidine kinase